MYKFCPATVARFAMSAQFALVNFVMAQIVLAQVSRTGGQTSDADGSTATHPAPVTTDDQRDGEPAGKQVAISFAALSNEDPQTRASARDHLMLLAIDHPDEVLEQLRQVLRDAIATSGPINAQQRRLLQDVVVQASLLREHRFTGKGRARLGIILSRSVEQEGTPALISLALPGTDAFRVLREGDLILSVSKLDGGPAGVARQPPQIISQSFDLIAYLETVEPGDWVQLLVQRDGKQLDIRVRTWPGEAWAVNANQGIESASAAYRRGLDTWRRDFVPLIGSALARP